MISVPDAALLPITPRPVRCVNASITSSGKPCGYVGIGSGVTIPISSQWPVVVSLPFERSSRRPATAGAPGCGGQPSSGLDVPEAERFEVGQVEPADGPGDVAERVRPLVAVLRRVRQLAGPDGVEHDHAGARHGAAILVLGWTPSSDSSASSSGSSACRVRGRVTWVVVKI